MDLIIVGILDVYKQPPRSSRIRVYCKSARGLEETRALPNVQLLLFSSSGPVHSYLHQARRNPERSPGVRWQQTLLLTQDVNVLARVVGQ